VVSTRWRDLPVVHREKKHSTSVEGRGSETGEPLSGRGACVASEKTMELGVENACPDKMEGGGKRGTRTGIGGKPEGWPENHDQQVPVEI